MSPQVSVKGGGNLEIQQGRQHPVEGLNDGNLEACGDEGLDHFKPDQTGPDNDRVLYRMRRDRLSNSKCILDLG